MIIKKHTRSKALGRLELFSPSKAELFYLPSLLYHYPSYFGIHASLLLLAAQELFEGPVLLCQPGRELGDHLDVLQLLHLQRRLPPPLLACLSSASSTLRLASARRSCSPRRRPSSFSRCSALARSPRSASSRRFWAAARFRPLEIRSRSSSASQLSSARRFSGVGTAAAAGFLLGPPWVPDS